MHNYHIDFIWQLNRLLLAASFLLGGLIMIYSSSRGWLAGVRARQLLILKKRLESVAASKSLAPQDKCELMIGKIDPLEAAEVVQNKKFVLSPQLHAQLRACFISQDKLGQIRQIALKSRNKWRRIQAMISLGASGDLQAIQVLARGLSDQDEDVVYFAMLALGQIKNAQSAKLLLEFLGKRVYSGYKIVSLLEDFPDLIVPQVIAVTQSGDPFVRFWCLKLLAKFKPAAYLEMITQLTQDSSADVRSAACECLGETGQPAAKEVLLVCIKDEAWFVRMRAVRALAKILKHEALPLITPLLKDPDLLVRESVKNALSLNH